ncbi:hypothetical protein DP132_00145 [Clostridium tetani]|nr:hypothetical protein DP132_00145 [Clostridium tetani]
MVVVHYIGIITFYIRFYIYHMNKNKV